MNEHENKWAGLEGPGYHLENLGRPAVFLLPSAKIEMQPQIEHGLRTFLTENFGAFTVTVVPSFGVWKDANHSVIDDSCLQYEVSFAGKDRIPLLAKKLAEIAQDINEQCIYLKAGQYSCLVYPTTG
ncbi:MAG: hypothetical protein Q8O87_03915 [bacterium]|nr:hypothetical protein [bacterium]